MKTRRFLVAISLILRAVTAMKRSDRVSLGIVLGELQELGGLYVKFLQMVAVQLDANGNGQFRDLMNVFEHSKPDQMNISAYLARYAPKALIVEDIEVLPLATGSFGQIYRGRYQGKLVAIKVLRPSIMETLHGDLRLLDILSRVFAAFDRQGTIDLRAAYIEFKNSCINEIDYRRELHVMQEYHRERNSNSLLYVPQVMPELCTRQVLVQEWIDGISLVTALDAEARGEDPSEFVRHQLGSDLFTQLGTVGAELLGRAAAGMIVQADPHPGNILLMRDNHVALIDYGMVTSLTKDRAAFVGVLEQYQKIYAGEMEIDGYAMAILSFLDPKLHAALVDAKRWLGNSVSLESRIKAAVLEQYQQGSNAATIDGMLDRRMVMRILFYVINRGNQFGFNFNLEHLNLLKAAQSYLVLVGRFDTSGIVIKGVIDTVLAQVELSPLILASDEAIRLTPAEGMEVLSVWFDRIGRRNPWLMYQISQGAYL